ncbi:LysR family transcriptional regulator [Burkholderia contaminans]|uniref:LysR family transcriptional regulator n=1 Tax=Burkholderia cepacia complex TaxID=87882 RepID=UPI00064A6A09|nr:MULTISPECIES: LysR family transcriptional regulator [Burkholderia cepacia complex]AKM45274.1 LysR family transcriptional regulator [Burkholderia contaminans]MCA8157954.1 LysR family transcriptional regulator [Burkholderia contaminans]MDR8032054.1 LysR family transcriptional regulator [Burkholderia cenocepacia]RQT01210.1 LysR family transcriptional regulator [Burkholderia contaminans]RQT07501.1 LysR family transcriptional regulator [Burkholderia contaminans]
MLDLQYLSILKEVQRLGSLTAAAERLNVTQSALSHMVRKFEERHGVKFWTKNGRGLRFTHAGEYLLALAERVLPQIEHAERTLVEFAEGRRGALRVGMECHPCQKWLTRLTSRYLASWPDVDYDVRTAFGFDGVAALLGYEIDLLVTPDPIDLPDVVFEPVIDYELMLVVHEQHPLAAREFALPHDLLAEELITVPVSKERLDIYTRFLLPAHCRPKFHRTAEQTELMLQLVAAHRGVAVLPDWLVIEEGAAMPIRAVRLGRDGIHKSIHLGLRRGEEDVAYIAGFLALARQFDARSAATPVERSA